MTKNFNKMDLNAVILKSIETLGYQEATEVQEKAIPEILSGRDIVVQSQTGSGKTAAFVIPLCEKIVWENRLPQAIVLAPTRELAMQIEEDVFNIGRFKRIKSEAIYGRSSFETQARKLKEMTHIVVATPGRLIDHIERGTIDLSEVNRLVIDEADELFNMGFLDQVGYILSALPKNTQKMMFSATLPEAVKALMKTYLHNATMITVRSQNPVSSRINQAFCLLGVQRKEIVLEKVLVVENPNTAIIFCNTKESVDNLTQFLQEKGIQAERIHGEMEQRNRTQVMQDFKRGKFRYLVATDIAARGIDVDDINLVVNFDVPENYESYTHRIGRSARHDNLGKALTLCADYEKRFLDLIINESAEQIKEYKVPGSALYEAKYDGFMAKQESKIKFKNKKDEGFKKEIMRIHINAGKKSKMRPLDIVGSLTSIEGIVAEDIGVIEIIDVASFVEILNNKGKLVLKSLKRTPIKGKIRKASEVYKQNY